MGEKGSVFDLYADAPAIRELGPLFKLTSVYLWDHGREKGGKSCKGPANGVVGSETACSTSGGDELMEDTDLAKEMSALGLPVSFKTAKENNRITSKGRTNGRQSNVCRWLPGGELVENAVSGVLHGNSGNCVSSEIALDASYVYHVTDDLNGLYHFSGQRWLSSSGNEIDHVVMKELVSTEMSDIATSCMDIESTITEDTSYDRLIIEADKEITDEDRISSQIPSTVSGRTDNSFALQSTSLGNHVDVGMEINNSNQEHISTEKLASPSGSEMFHPDDIGDYQCKGDWLMFWDEYYKRHYFYNVKTQVSTWLEPLGFEHSLYHDSTGMDGKLEPTNSASLAQCNSCSEIADPIQEHVDSYKDNYEKHDSVDQCSGDVLHSTKLILASCNSCSELENAIQDRVDSSRYIVEEHGVAGQPSDEIYYSGITMSRLEDGISKLSSGIEIEERDRSQLVEDGCSEMSECFGTPENGIREANILAEGHSFPLEYRICPTDDLNGQSTSRKRKQRVRKPHGQKKVLQDHEELSFPLNEEYSAFIQKYWLQRYILFSRFDSGIKMDEEGWFSVTPETIAKHHAFRCTGGVVVDGFTGVGGNAIHFAQCGRHVIAVDIDPKKIEYAHHNAIIYEVGDQIDFIKGDFFNLASKLKADIVFLSPPWGGPNYSKVKKYDLKTMLKPHDGFFLFHTARKVASKVVMFLPKNVDLNQLAKISLSVQPPWLLEVERNYLNGKLKAVTAYFTRHESGDGNCITSEVSGGPVEELWSTV